MQVFKAYCKTLYVHKFQMILYFSIFMFILMMMGNSGRKEAARSYIGSKNRVALIDNDNSEMSKAVREYLEKTAVLVPADAADTDKLSMEKINDNANFGMIDYAVIIPDGFEEKVAAGDCDNVLEYVRYPKSASGYLMTQRMNSFIKDISVYLKSGISENDALKMALDASETEAEVTMLDTADKDTSGGMMFYYYLFYAYAVLMMIIIGIGNVNTEFKDEELIRRIECSPMSPLKKNLQMIAGYMVTGLGIWALFQVIAVILFHGAPGFSGIISYAANTLVITVVGLSLAFMIGTLVKDENVVNMVANVLVMGMSFLSGIFVTMEYLSSSVLSFARFLPTYWFVKADYLVADGTAAGNNMALFTGYLLIQLLFAAVFIACGFAVSKIKKN